MISTQIQITSSWGTKIYDRNKVDFNDIYTPIHNHIGAKANSAQKREEDRASKREGGYGEKTGEERGQRKEEEGTGGRKHRS